LRIEVSRKLGSGYTRNIRRYNALRVEFDSHVHQFPFFTKYYYYINNLIT